MIKVALCSALMLVSFGNLEALPLADPKNDLPATCPVSGEKLGEMGTPVSIDYQGKKVSFCCDSCIVKFQKEPAKYLAKFPATVKP